MGAVTGFLTKNHTDILGHLSHGEQRKLCPLPAEPASGEYEPHGQAHGPKVTSARPTPPPSSPCAAPPGKGETMKLCTSWHPGAGSSRTQVPAHRPRPPADNESPIASFPTCLCGQGPLHRSKFRFCFLETATHDQGLPAEHCDDISNTNAARDVLTQNNYFRGDQ